MVTVVDAAIYDYRTLGVATNRLLKESKFLTSKGENKLYLVKIESLKIGFLPSERFFMHWLRHESDKFMFFDSWRFSFS